MSGNGRWPCQCTLDDAAQVFPDAKLTNGTVGLPGGFNEDTPRWTDLAAAAAAGGGMAVWYNVLPPYIAKQPLWKYAPNPPDFVNNPGIFNCPTSTPWLLTHATLR